MSNNNNESETLVVDALGTGVVKDYSRLMKEFGINPMRDAIEAVPKDKLHNLITRGVMFGQTDLKPIFETILKEEKFGIMSGIKPSGSFHVGSMTTAQEIIYFQKFGGRVSYAIADIESYVASGLAFDKAEQIAIDNVADLFALGLDTNPERTFIYSQSKDMLVQKYGHIFASHVTLNTLRSIYGEKLRVGYYNAALIQVADILRPQMEWGPMPTITPIGADQAPHARLTRDIARKQAMQEEFKFNLPSFSYHLMLQGIDGSDKMSKSIPMSVFTFEEDMKSINKKINNALTGGRDTAAEQREKGADPDKCRVFDLFKFAFEADDKALKERERICRSGELLCGYCKNDLKAAIEEYRKDHNEKKEQMIELATVTVRTPERL